MSTKSISSSVARFFAVVQTLVLVGGWDSAFANPPAPFNLVYGLVRDKYGTPLTATSAMVLLETPAGTVISAPIVPGHAPGVNYRMKVPMDSGETPVVYQATAQFAGAPYKLFVVVNNATNLPIEMTGNFASLGKPGQTARVDLTLGVDSNGDGIPDSWEYAFLTALGLNIPLSELNANSILTNDGLTLRQQYLFGTYPFNPSAPCLVTFSGFIGEYADLKFPTITGRYYSVLSSTDGKKWSTASFFLPGDDQSGPPRTYLYASGIGTGEVYVVPLPSLGQSLFYRILVQ